MQTCKGCGKSKPLSDFYGNGYIKKCKECIRAQVTKRRRENPEVQVYERERAKRPERKAYVAEIQRRRRAKFPEKNQAHCKVSRAKKNGDLIPQPCIICGKEAEAHHPDYGKALDVTWLCFDHHRALHNGILCLLIPF